MFELPGIHSRRFPSNDSLSRRNFLKISGLAAGGVAITAIRVWAAEDEGGTNRLLDIGVALPAVAEGRTSMLADGKICVVGLATHGSSTLEAVYAKVFYGSTTAPTPNNDPTMETGAVPGKAFSVTQVSEQTDYNFRFVVESGNNLVPGADDDRAAGLAGDNKNWLVVWAKFDGVWYKENFHLRCFELPFTDCVAGWYDSFQFATETNSLEDTTGELTPGGYEPEENFDDAWKVVAGKKAAGNIGPNSTAVLMFDPGLSAFVATHKVTIPGGGTTVPWQMWALRSVRHQDSDNRWQWQIGHYYDDASYKFHELVESVGGNSTQRDFATIVFDIATEYPCKISLDDNDVIKATFDVDGANESELVFQSEELSGETTQALNTYYDDSAQPGTLTKFDDIQVARAIQFPLREAAPAPAVKERTIVDEAFVLCKLKAGRSGAPHQGGGPRERKCFRPTVLNPGEADFVKGASWRWEDVGRVEAPETGHKDRVGIYRVTSTADLKTAMDAVHKKGSCFVLWRKGDTTGTAAPDLRIGRKLLKAEATAINVILEAGDYKKDLIATGDEAGEAAIKIIDEIRAQSEKRKFRRWKKDHRKAIKALETKIEDAIDGLPEPAEPEKRRHALKKIRNMTRRQEILWRQFLKAQRGLSKK
ncbi:MAG: twin-arginine translocation signal domain-containing protein [Planctomycetales bacterium]